MSVYRAFSTPLYRDTIKLDKKVLNPILSGMKFFRLPSDDGWASEDVYILDNDLAPLKPMIQEKIEDMVFNDWKFEDHYTCKILNSWVMKHKTGDESTIHHHTNSLFSGILYLQCDEDSGSLMFLNKNNWCGNVFSFDFKEINPLNQDMVGITPSEGDIIMFPSTTQHMVSQSASKYSRFCVAFNVWLEGPLNKKSKQSNSQLVL